MPRALVILYTVVFLSFHNYYVINESQILETPLNLLIYAMHSGDSIWKQPSKVEIIALSTEEFESLTEYTIYKMNIKIDYHSMRHLNLQPLPGSRESQNCLPSRGYMDRLLGIGTLFFSL